MRFNFSIITVVIALLFNTYVTQAATLPESVNDALDQLNAAIKKQDEYISKRTNSIDSLKTLSTKNNQSKADLYKQIGDLYCKCNIDSALVYYQKAIDEATLSHDSIAQQSLQLSKIAIEPVQGIVKESIEKYDSIGTKLFAQNKHHYYEVGNRLFYFIASFYPQDNIARIKYENRALQATDSLYSIINKSTTDAQLYLAQIHSLKKNQPLMVSELKEIVSKGEISQSNFARASSHLAEYYGSIDKVEEETYYLILASLSDIYSGTLEGTALQNLGVILSKQGNVDLAYDYLVLSLNNAIKSGSRIRALQTAEVYPIIAQTIRTNDQNRLTLLTWLIIALIIALTIIVYSLIFLRKEMKKLSDLKVKLAQANVTKDTYISQFLSLSSIYIEKLEEFHRVAKRKLKANQTADLYTLIESESMLNEQSQMFYKIFDNAFIHIYPTFVNDVNALLQPDKRIELPALRLNTELRILAFLRLGIDDSEQISRFLGLSINTIYTYRNKLKSKAINRITFDSEVMKIGSIS